MEAKLYLGEITQEKIDVKAFSRHYAPDRACCCNGFCCILDFSKGMRPEDLVGNPPYRISSFPRISVGVKRSRLNWLIRKEDFGGLLWNLRTGHIFQLDGEAYTILNDMANGKNLTQLSGKYKVEISDIHQLLSDITKKYESQ